MWPKKFSTAMVAQIERGIVDEGMRLKRLREIATHMDTSWSFREPEVFTARRQRQVKAPGPGPSPVAVQEQTLPSQFEEYMRIAKEIGYSPSKVAGMLLRNFLQMEEIHVYPRNRVADYLRERANYFGQTRGGSYRVEWVALREKDKMSNGVVYSETVPVEVLQIVARVEKGFTAKVADVLPDTKVIYQVSTIQRDPDPFLRVKFGDATEVIAKWDEPGFSIMDIKEKK